LLRGILLTAPAPALRLIFFSTASAPAALRKTPWRIHRARQQQR
jgi:hypothetical protein